MSQVKVMWHPDIVIDQSSFTDTPPDLEPDQLQEMSFYTTYDFSYQMSNAQFALTKNFNKYVDAYYVPSLSWIENGELTDDLLSLANLHYDITELFARRFRKSLYENKKFGSSGDWFNQSHMVIENDRTKLLTEINNKLRASTSWQDIIATYSTSVNDELIELGQYCKTCKPKKKKRNKR